MKKQNIIHHIEKATDNRFLNLYAFSIETKAGQKGIYAVASRANSRDRLKAVSHSMEGDGVAIYAIYGENNDHVVLIRQYRFPLNDYVYEFPAGLIEHGESMEDAAQREMKEETGLSFSMKKCHEAYTRPYFSSVGMTDESVGIVYGYASGKPDLSLKEEAEDIQVILADRNECKRILKEERVSLLCAYMLMHFIHEEGEPFAFTDEL